VAVKDWRDIWLNEGFATYASVLYDEQHGEGTAQAWFARMSAKPADWSGWRITPGDPGRKNLFHYEGIYARGAMAVHAIRQAVGDEVFFRLLKAWPARHRAGNASVADFRALTESLSGKDLGALFTAWLYTPSKPTIMIGQSGS
jgi:aminopeptidase N